MTKNKILITSKVAVFTHNDRTHTVMKSNEHFQAVVDALKDNDTGKAQKVLETKKPSRIRIKNNDLYFDEKKFDPIFAEAYAVAKEYGLSTDKLEVFFKNLDKNPSKISVGAFSSFLAKSKMPITDRGTFLAYKKVSGVFLDLYTRKFDNRPGAVCSMPRNSVDSNQNQTCSTGFHICSHTYLGNYGNNDYHAPGGNKLIVCEIHPKDVVAVPPDYQMTKMRVASYRVLCTLDYFKAKLLTYEADALGMIPIFNTQFFKNNWEPLSDVDDKSQPETFMTPENWLKSREKAV